jgi:apolipoprotein D and lipocalin family protein
MNTRSFIATFVVPLWIGLTLSSSLLAQATPPTRATSPAPAPLQSIAQVDLARYQGLWYQIALYPNRFQKQCLSGTQADYASEPGGTIRVTNSCITASGERTSTIGQARAVGQLSNGQLQPAQLKVNFAPAWLSWLPFVWGNYWVIQLAPDYRYAVIGEPSREFLWVLARQPLLSEADWSAIRTQLTAQGYDPGSLVMEKH